MCGKNFSLIFVSTQANKSAARICIGRIEKKRAAFSSYTTRKQYNILNVYSREQTFLQ